MSQDEYSLVTISDWKVVSLHLQLEWNLYFDQTCWASFKSKCKDSLKIERNIKYRFGSSLNPYSILTLPQLFQESFLELKVWKGQPVQLWKLDFHCHHKLVQAQVAKEVPVKFKWMFQNLKPLNQLLHIVFRLNKEQIKTSKNIAKM